MVPGTIVQDLSHLTRLPPAAPRRGVALRVIPLSMMETTAQKESVVTVEEVTMEAVEEAAEGITAVVEVVARVVQADPAGRLEQY